MILLANSSPGEVKRIAKYNNRVLTILTDGTAEPKLCDPIAALDFLSERVVSRQLTRMIRQQLERC